jgi:hypothetical protein
MGDEVYDCIAEDLLEQSFSCRDFASRRIPLKQADQPLFSQKWQNNQRIGYAIFMILGTKTELLDLENCSVTP